MLGLSLIIMETYTVVRSFMRKESYRNFRIATRFVMLAAQTIFQEKKSNNALRDERARGQIARRTGDELMVYRNLTLNIY